jgi:hypothetical protein
LVRFSTFSMRAAQAAQVMPVSLKSTVDTGDRARSPRSAETVACPPIAVALSMTVEIGQVVRPEVAPTL